MKNYLHIACTLCAVLVLSGCAGVSVRDAVPEADKDPENAYDGRYSFMVKHPGGRQELTANWYANCSPRDFKSVLVVKDSEVTINWGKKITMQGFVDDAGRFRVTAPLEAKVNVIGGVAADGGIDVVVQGVLDDSIMEGRLLYAQKEHIGRGCTYPITYAKLSAS